jgi:hypothetical protein
MIDIFFADLQSSDFEAEYADAAPDAINATMAVRATIALKTNPIFSNMCL